MKILLISVAGIGDTLIATPLIHEVRLNYPEARIDAFVLTAGSKDLLQHNPHLSAVHQCNLMKARMFSSLGFVLRLRRERYDISINTHPQSRIEYRMIARLIGAPIRLSHSYDNSSALDRCLVNRLIPQNYSIHGVENNLDLLNALAKKPLLPQHHLELHLAPAEESWADDYLKNTGDLARSQRLGIHVGSGATKNLQLKRWPLENYIELIRRLLADDPNLRILLFGGPEEKEAHPRIQQETKRQAVFAPQTGNFLQAAALLRHCHAFLSVDTALMHMAAAMKVPNQVVIEAPTLNVTNLPYKNPYTLVPNPAVAGRNLEYYRYDGGPIRGSNEELIRCMQSVTVDAVYEKVRQVLKKLSTPGH